MQLEDILDKNKKNNYFLEDGEFVNLKSNLPKDLSDLRRLIIAMANSKGGYIVFGVRNNKEIGLTSDTQECIDEITKLIKDSIVGVNYSFHKEEKEGKRFLILKVEQSETIAYFPNKGEKVEREIAYFIEENADEKGNKNNEGKNQPKISIKYKRYYSRVYKYMTLDAFISSLYTRKWRFFEPSKWKDKFEQRFYCADYKFSPPQYNPQQVFATCVTRRKNSEAAWKVYASGQGLNAKCVQLELDIVELRKQLRTSGFKFEERPVEYLSEYDILNLHAKGSKYYNKYFTPFTLNSFLELLSLKREAYSYEEELRLFMLPQNEDKSKYNDRHGYKDACYKGINIDWKRIIKKIRIDKKCSDGELLSIQMACFFVGINLTGYKFIASAIPPIGSKDVELELFDIDEMPEKGRITIR